MKKLRFLRILAASRRRALKTIVKGDRF